MRSNVVTRGSRRTVADSEWIAYENDWFVVEQCRRCLLPGYLVVRSRRHALSLGNLSADAALELGPLLQRVVRSVEAVLQAARVYVAQFGEEGGDLHFHVFPRTERLTREYLLEFPGQNDVIHGPMLLDWARERYRDEPAPPGVVETFKAIREHLSGSATRHAAAPDGAAAPRAPRVNRRRR